MFAVRLGNEYRYNYELVVADFSELTAIQSMFNRDGFIDYNQHDDFFRIATQSRSEIKAVGKSAPLQYFLIAAAGRFMPHKKYYSPGFNYIFTKEDADRSSRAINEKKSSLSLLPHISTVDDIAGNFTVLAWSCGRLQRQVYIYSIYDGKISCNFDGSYEVEEITGDDSELRFRE